MFPYVYRIFQRIGMSNKIRKYINNHNLPIRIIFTPGRKLNVKDIFCSFRPYDKKYCFSSRCTICPRFSDSSDRQLLACVYKIKILLLHASQYLTVTAIAKTGTNSASKPKTIFPIVQCNISYLLRGVYRRNKSHSPRTSHGAQ